MVVTLVLSGVPRHIHLTDLAYQIDKFLKTDEVGSFVARDLPNHHRTGKRQVALDFKDGFHAMGAQDILNGYKYELPNDREYTLSALVTCDPSLKPTSSNIYSNELVSYSSRPSTSEHAFEVSHLSEQAFKEQLQLMKKRLKVIETETELLKAEKKLKKAKRKLRKDSGSESESDYSKRKRKRKRKHKKRRRDSSSSSSSFTAPPTSSPMKASMKSSRKRSDSSHDRSQWSQSPTRKHRRVSPSPDTRRSSSKRLRSPRASSTREQSHDCYKLEHRQYDSQERSRSRHRSPQPTHSRHRSPLPTHSRHRSPQPTHSRHRSPQPTHSRHRSPQPTHSLLDSPEPARSSYDSPRRSHSRRRSARKSPHSPSSRKIRSPGKPSRETGYKDFYRDPYEDAYKGIMCKRRPVDQELVYLNRGKDRYDSTRPAATVTEIEEQEEGEIKEEEEGEIEEQEEGEIKEEEEGEIEEQEEGEIHDEDVDEILQSVDGLIEEDEEVQSEQTKIIKITLRGIKKNKPITNSTNYDVSIRKAMPAPIMVDPHNIKKEQNEEVIKVEPYDDDMFTEPPKQISKNPKFVLPVSKVIKKMNSHIKTVEEDIQDKLLGIMRKILRLRIKELLKGTTYYMRTAAIVELYRENFDANDDAELVQNVLEHMKEGSFDDFVASDEEDEANRKKKGKKKSNEHKDDATVEKNHNDDVLIVEKNLDVIDISDTEEDNRIARNVYGEELIPICKIKKEIGLASKPTGQHTLPAAHIEVIDVDSDEEDTNIRVKVENNITSDAAKETEEEQTNPTNLKTEVGENWSRTSRETEKGIIHTNAAHFKIEILEENWSGDPKESEDRIIQTNAACIKTEIEENNSEPARVSEEEIIQTNAAYFKTEVEENNSEPARVSEVEIIQTNATCLKTENDPEETVESIEQYVELVTKVIDID